MEQKQSSSQIKANPISNENVEEHDIQEKNEVEQLEEQKHPQQQQAKKQKQLKPDFVYCPNNKNIDDLIKTYPHLESLQNAKELDLEAIGEAESFVIRSNNDDDIHKAIKYEVWCSTTPNNEMLDTAFKKAQAENKDIYLFYSVVKSGQFVGVAKLKSALNEETFAYWWQHSKWKGHFKIEWLFIKDITYKQFETLKNENDMSVTRSKDGTRIDWKETGLPMLKIYQAAKDEPNIFQDFEHMDQREQFQRYIRSQQAQGHHHHHHQHHHYQQQGQQQNMYSYPPNSQQMMYYQQQYQQYQGQQNQQSGQMAYHPYYQQYYYQQPRFNNAYPPTNNQYRSNNNNSNYQQNPNNSQNPHYKKHHYNKNKQNTNGYKKYYNNNQNKHHNNNQNKQQQQPVQQQQENKEQQEK